MITKLVAAFLFIVLFVLLLALLLSKNKFPLPFIWKLFKVKRADFASFKDLITTVVALFTVLSIFILASEVEIVRESFIIDHRPFISINMNDKEHNTIGMSDKKPDEVSLTLAIVNKGESSADNFSIKAESACVTEKEMTNINELDECFREGDVKIIEGISFGKISLYPEDQGAGFRTAVISRKNLYTDFVNGKQIYLNFILTYDGPVFKGQKFRYRSEILMYFSSEGKILMISREEQERKIIKL